MNASNRKIRSIAIAFCLLTLISGRAYAWGARGHRILAQLALKELQREAPTDPKAKKARNTILTMFHNNNTTLEEGAVWPDLVRRTEPYKYADNWHFVSIPRTETAFNATNQCRITETAPEGDCAIGGLAHFKKVFMNSTNAQDRLDALRFIIHFVGDLHQPLHTSEDLSFIHNNKPGDRGGNYRLICFLSVSLNGCNDVFNNERQSKNLHSAWDKYMIAHLHANEHQYIEELNNKIKSMSAAERANLMSGDPSDWAEAAHALAVAAAYDVPKVSTLTVAHDSQYDDYFFVDSNYEKTNMKRSEDQLIRAGLRLAAFLKQMF